jgi:hypothetical protein
MQTESFLLVRTGNVLDIFLGSRAEALLECDRRNSTDVGGTTEILSGPFESRAEALSALDAAI